MKTNSPYLLAAAALLCCLVAGCNDNKTNVRQLEAFLQKPPSEVSGREYRVLPPDVLAISSLHVPEINGQRQQIRPDGKINLPLLGEVYVAGHTPGEIEQALTEAASDYYGEVDATVQVIGYHSQMVYVFGQVLRPGPVPWTGTDTLLDILAKVQPTELSWPEKIKVVRAHPPKKGGYVPGFQAQADPKAAQDDSARTVTVTSTEPEHGDSQIMAQELTINMTAMVETGDFSHNILLQPYDVVYVPPNPFAAVGLWLRNILFPTRPVLEAISIPARMENVTQP